MRRKVFTSFHLNENLKKNEVCVVQSNKSNKSKAQLYKGNKGNELDVNSLPCELWADIRPSKKRRMKVLDGLH